MTSVPGRKKNYKYWLWLYPMNIFNTLRPRQNGRHFADATFKRISLNENVRNLINISLKFVPKGQIHNITSLVQIMAWRWPGDKPLSGPMMVRLLMHICVTRPQWAKAMYSSASVCLYRTQTETQTAFVEGQPNLLCHGFTCYVSIYWIKHCKIS